MICDECNKKTVDLWITTRVLCKTCHIEDSALFTDTYIITNTEVHDGNMYEDIKNTIVIIEETE